MEPLNGLTRKGEVQTQIAEITKGYLKMHHVRHSQLDWESPSTLGDSFERLPPN